MAEQVEAFYQFAGVLLLLALLLYEPVQKLHGAEILDRVRGVINIMDKPGHIVFMFQPGSERSPEVLKHLVRLGDGLQSYFLSVVLQVLDEQHGVVPFLLGLDLVPVGKAVQLRVLVVVGKIQIQISGVKFFVYLGVNKFCYLFI